MGHRRLAEVRQKDRRATIRGAVGLAVLLPSLVLALVRPRGDDIALVILAVGFLASMAISRRDVTWWPY
jgi:hypothetical protein